MLANESDRRAEEYLGAVFLFHAVERHVRKPRRGTNVNAPMNGVLGLVCPRTPTTHWIFCFSAFRMRLRSSSILRFCCAMPPYSPGAYRAGNSIVGPVVKVQSTRVLWKNRNKYDHSTPKICHCAWASHHECIWGSGDEDPHIANFATRWWWVLRHGSFTTWGRPSIPTM